MHTLAQLSPRCFPEKTWKRSDSPDGGYTQVMPDEADMIRREAIAAWQLGYCSLPDARAALQRIRKLETHYKRERLATLRGLALGGGA